MESDAVLHSGSLWAVILWIVFFSSFLLFLPVCQKQQWKPAGLYLLYTVCMAVEMFAIRSPEGFLRGSLLQRYIGTSGHIVFLLCVYSGGMLVVAGWAVIRRSYWSADDGDGFLVTAGPYRFIRHPQYAGILFVALGMLFEWTGLINLVLFPVLCVLYGKLAAAEEAGLAGHFGAQWIAYRNKTGMFFPAVKK